MAIEPINVEALEDAIRAWVMGSTGYGEEAVIYADQDTDAPSPDYITIRLGDLIRVGGPASEEQTGFDAAAPAGQEITNTIRVPREFVVTLQAFSAATHGSSAARAVLAKAQAGIEMSTYRAPLNAAGLGVIDVGTVQWVPAVYGAGFEGRAVLDVRFLVVQTATEKVGYIATVETVDLTGNDSIDI